MPEPEQGGSVSVIIPTLHAPRLHETIQALTHQSHWDAIDEIIVAGRQDAGAWQEMPKVRYIHTQRQPSPAHNRNIAAATATSAWLAFTDSDCVPDSSWLAQALTAAHSAGVPAVAGSVTVPPDTEYWGLADHLLVFGQVIPQAPAQMLTRAATLNFCVRRDWFLALGGFDETFPTAAGEDTDFCERLVAAGGRILFVPQAGVEHRHRRQGLAEVWRHIAGYGAATTRRRLLRGMDGRWQLASRLARLPGVLEVAAVGRAGMRAPGHLRWILQGPADGLWAWPGVVLLEYALATGMIDELRRSGG